MITMKKVWVVLVVSWLSTLAAYSNVNDHKIIFLISPPRSLSTAFLRMMDARGDFTVINEITWFAFDLTVFNPKNVKPLFKPGTPSNFKEIKEFVYKKAQTSHVFVKEISFAIAAFLLEDDELIKDPNVYFVFLVRDPHASLISFYKKQLSPLPYEKFGYRGCQFIFEKVKNHGANQPIIILTEDLAAHAHEVVKELCAKVEIPFIPESLRWQNLGDNFDGSLYWHDGKQESELYHWHGDAIHSTGFGRLSQYKVDADGKPTFEEVINERDRSLLLDGYSFNFPFYQMLLTETDYICRGY